MATERALLESTAFLAAVAGKSMPPEQIEAYRIMLRDVPDEILPIACQRAVAENPFPTIVPVAIVLKHADTMTAGQRMTYGEAWELACQAARTHGYRKPLEGLASLPPVVAHAVKAFGWSRLCDCPMSGDRLGTEVAQFREIFNGLNHREEFERMLPAATQAASAVSSLVGELGRMPMIEG